MDCMGQGADSASSDDSYSEYESYEEDLTGRFWKADDRSDVRGCATRFLELKQPLF